MMWNVSDDIIYLTVYVTHISLVYRSDLVIGSKK